MKNLSLGSKVRYLVGATLGLFLVLGFLMSGQGRPSSLTWTIYTLIALLLVLTFYTVHRILAGIRNLTGKLRAAAQGDLDQRLTGIKAGAATGDLAWAMNDLMDQQEAYFREVLAAFDHASRGQTFRMAMDQGLHGAFKEAMVRFRKSRRGTLPAAPAADLVRIQRDLADKLRRDSTPDDIYSHLMYPEVFAEFARHQREFSDVSVIPTVPFFYGLKPGDEITISIEAGKTLFIKLVNVSTPDKDGRRTVTYELNGMTRESSILDKGVTPKAKPRPKADIADLLQVGAPIPGLIVAIAVTVGQKVARGDKLLMMEAMKMQTTVYAPADGLIDKLHVQIGDTVESKDMLLKLH